MRTLIALVVLAAGLDAGSVQWPAPGSELRPQRLERPRGSRRWRLYLDAGHGAEGNEGVASVTCEQEMDFTLRVAQDLAQRLESTGRFQVKLSLEDAMPRSIPGLDAALQAAYAREQAGPPPLPGTSREEFASHDQDRISHRCVQQQLLEL